VGARRWWIYQRERFPLLLHAPLIGAFTSSAVCLSALLRGAAAAGSADGPRWPAFVAAFGTGLTFFLQLRIADEFKDHDDDARHRPYRPVPRGLVTLRELAAVGRRVPWRSSRSRSGWTCGSSACSRSCGRTWWG
jgi:4-hydroxybenzoate polyprenyltransferase